MAFKLRSGNKTGFKSMGSSPAQHRLTRTITTGKGYEGPPGKGKIVEKTAQQDVIHEHPEKGGEKKSPVKQRLTKGGEGKDQDKIFDAKGNHIGNWVNDKKVMFDDKPTTDPKLNKKLIQHQKEKMKARDRAKPNKAKDKALDEMLKNTQWAPGQVKRPKLKKHSPVKQNKEILDKIQEAKKKNISPFERGPDQTPRINPKTRKPWTENDMLQRGPDTLKTIKRKDAPNPLQPLVNTLPITRLARKLKQGSKKISAIAKGGEIVAKGLKKKKK